VDTVVVGIDRSAGAAAALRWAADEARLMGARLSIVHAYLAPLAYAGPEEQIARIDPELHARTLRRLEGYVADAGVDLTGLEVTTTLHPGRAADGLLTAAGSAQLLVTGSRGAGGFVGSLLGSTAVRCARHAPCPAVVVPPSLPDDLSRIVVGVDGSTTAVRALRWAVGEAARRGASVEAIGVYHPYDARGPYGGDFMQVADPGSTERFHKQAEQHVEDAIAALGPVPGIEVTCCVDAGHPARVLIDHAADAGLLVIGRREHHGFLLGSTARQVLHGARTPVVVLPTEVP
jgi:nucleotide-binding universal stress UspA family protein